MRTILPFRVKMRPVRRLALISFEKQPDSLYTGMEFQYLDGEKYGTGYRVLASRTDGYIDIYDDTTLVFNPDENCDFVQKGLKNHLQVPFRNPVFKKDNGNVYIEFAFCDILQREIRVRISENSKKKSTPMNLLAPLGVGCEKTPFMPVFFLYNFDFVRRRKTDVSITIGERSIKLDPFLAPVPLGGQWRYYTRYSMDSQIIEFLPTDRNQVAEVELDENMQYKEKNTVYQFTLTENEVSLSCITLREAKPVQVCFEPALSLNGGVGTFCVKPEPEMGHIKGVYTVENGSGKIQITIVPDQGWTSVPNSFTTKMILSPKSVFCNWCKKYQYTQTIDKASLESESAWVNDNI